MSFKYIRSNLILFFVIYLFIIIFVYFISYNFVIKNFLELESKQNKANINTLLSNINNQLVRIHGNANDYAKWDDSYSFLNNTHPQYIYENFREGTTAIQDLNLDFILYVTLNQKSFFSRYESDFLKESKTDFEDKLIESYVQDNNINTLFKYKQHYLYISKIEISNSDETKKPNGYLFMGKIINHQELNNISKVFKSISFYNTKSSESSVLDYQFAYIPQAKVVVNLMNSTLKNEIQIYDIHQKHILSIMTQNDRDIVNNGIMTILIFNIIIDVFIFIILFILYRNQKNLEIQNDFLEAKVKRRTNQLNRSLKKLQIKNSELYNLANKDYLTKINNRRSYFQESEKLLLEAILENHDLSVLIIDVDNFKQINDKYGHAIGDKILIAFCDIVNDIIGYEAIFGRIGGEEFCLTFKNKSLDETALIAERIRKKCETSTLHLEGQTIQFTISLGLSDRKNYQHIDEILQHADELLYNAKKTGRNRMIRTTLHK